MKKPTISFILGIYNAERTLKECISSILQQEYSKENYEIVIIDGGSHDKTLSIVKEFQRDNKNIRLLHNPYKLSEGRGMGKDQGVRKAEGDILVFLDHDNILLGKTWIKEIIKPFRDKKIWASQSLLKSVPGDSLFLRYVNNLGVEDPFAAPYSLVAQIVLDPKQFPSTVDYFLYTLEKRGPLFIGANGCAFRREVFDIIGGYTRDVDVSASMAEHNMTVAVPKRAFLYHATSSNFLTFLKKKGLYFFRFINNEYKAKKFDWTRAGKKGNKLDFLLMILFNLTFIAPLGVVIHKFFERGEIFWLLHPFYVFFVTFEYGFITLFRIKNFLKYVL